MDAVTGRQAQWIKRYYDTAVKPETFKEGEFVLLYNPQKQRGLYAKWQVTWTGPMHVMKCLNDAKGIIFNVKHVYVRKTFQFSKTVLAETETLRKCVCQTSQPAVEAVYMLSLHL